eukprot:TRINITY_DN73079_c0_g1_i1.p1 TRINITY_DN73079_c0_g1~~TRINITY_DN73079_c0_g1_i1.p1  ORF type:complete len:407 (-),score=57.82 TRINITY_DN73079_c0_g1_i1:162-1382(-)
MSVSPEGTECVDLLEMEASAYMYIDGVTTMSFFDGPVPLDQLKERLVKIVQASPWIAGKLVKSKAKKIQMVFSSSPAAEAVLDTLLDQIELDISPAMPYESLIEKVKGTKAHVASGFTLMKKGLPYARFTVAKKDATSWALIASISHVVADGYTYYKVLNMLSPKEEITSLNPVRKHFFVKAVKEAVGPKEYATVMGATPMIMNFVGTMACGGKPRVRAFYVNPEKVKESKSKSSGTDFVSTNDVVTAFWGRLTGARLVEMAVNFRGRFPELTATDAGNYEGCILFSTDDCAEPANIRKALQREDGKFQSTLNPPRPLPGFCEMSRCRYRLTSNWASFFSELEFDGCTQALHLPYFSLGEIPTDILIMFKPSRTTLGAFIVTRKLSDDTLTNGDSLFGKQILPPAA